MEHLPLVQVTPPDAKEAEQARRDAMSIEELEELVEVALTQHLVANAAARADPTNLDAAQASYRTETQLISWREELSYRKAEERLRAIERRLDALEQGT